jgi:DNA-binding winged helix-turn-helix (wHTH) protein
MIAALGELQECKEKCFPTRYLRFGDLHLDLQRQVLTKNGVQVRLVGKMYDVLIALLQSPGEIVTRETLRAQVWPGKMPLDLDLDSNINTTVNKLRHTLENVFEVSIIKTVRREGYVLIEKVKYVDQPATIELPNNEQGSQRELKDSTRSIPAGIDSGQVWFMAGLIALTVAAMLFGAAITLYLLRPH